MAGVGKRLGEVGESGALIKGKVGKKDGVLLS
jgi:hypothetical protein